LTKLSERGKRVRIKVSSLRALHNEVFIDAKKLLSNVKDRNEDKLSAAI
jgi:hypothetical protein